MKVTLDLENLSDVVQSILEENLDSTVQDVIERTVEQFLNDKYASMIESTVNDHVQNRIKTYIESYMIQIGSGINTAVELMTPNDYINNQIAKIFESESFTVKKKDGYYGGVHEVKVPFSEVIKEHLDIDGRIKKQMEDFAKKLRNDVDAKMKQNYDDALKNALSNAVVDVLMSSEEFSRINNGIKRLSDA